ncbi:MAG: molybdenum cofactor guanylyltransferase [Magnetococcales bacterium]|nr:molybdenum cofactor guanylyltransferase [Magnetococcales bacterium]
MAERTDVIGILLAGGMSRRMGEQEKSLLPFGGTSLIAHVYARLAPQVDRVVISANEDPTRFAMLKAPVVDDLRPGRAGPLAGLEAVMTAHEAPWFVTVPTDTPWIPLDLVQRLAANAPDAHQVAIARSGEQQHPVVGLWPRSTRPLIQKALDEERRALKWWLRDHAHRLVDFPFSKAGLDPFFNINSPEDLKHAIQQLRQGGDA